MTVSAVPILSLVGVGRWYPGGVDALTGVNLAVGAGEFVAVVGPSGCGKTTLLRLAAGLLSPSRGCVSLTADRLAYVFQSPALLPWRRVRANVELVGELHRLPGAEVRRRAQDAIDLVGLTEFASLRPHALSAGMQMRVSLARSMTLQPDLFLLDEPFAALDEITRERLGDELLTLFDAYHFAALLVTHSVAEALYLASRVVVLSGRPGTVVDEFEVPFGYPRHPSLRFDADMADLVGRLHASLRAGTT